MIDVQTFLGIVGSVVFVLGVTMAVKSAMAAASEQQREAQDPQVILRHCRQELQLVEIELQSYPATRELHDIFDGIHSAQRTIDDVSRTLHKTENQRAEMEVAR